MNALQQNYSLEDVAEFEGGLPLLYSNVGDCRNRETVCKQFQMKCPDLAEEPLNEIADRLNNEYDPSAIQHFYRNYSPAKETLGAFYLWIKTNYFNDKNRRLYVQFFKGASCWQGAFVGSAEEIIKNEINATTKAKSKKEMQQNLAMFLNVAKDDLRTGVLEADIKPVEAPTLPVAAIEEPKVSPIITNTVAPTAGLIRPRLDVINAKLAETQTPAVKPNVSAESNDDGTDMTNIFPEEVAFYKTFMDKLLVKAGWSPANIKSYLFTMVSRENHLLENKAGEDYIVRSRQSENGTYYAMMNTSLLNTLGNPIKLIIAFDKRTQADVLSVYCSRWSICDSKLSALQHGFTKDDVNKELKPVVYYNDSPNELVFSAEIDDFDLENEGRLEHCISRKIERDKTGIAQLTDNQIYADIVRAIQTGIAISKYDTGYVKPMYNRKFNQIHFVIPYHVNGSFEKAPEMGIVVAPGNYGLWQVMTILDYNTVKNNCNCLSPYCDSSF